MPDEPMPDVADVADDAEFETVDTVTTDSQPEPAGVLAWPGTDPDAPMDDAGWDAIIREAEARSGYEPSEEEPELEAGAEGEEGEEEAPEHPEAVPWEHFQGAVDENRQLRELTVRQGQNLERQAQMLQYIQERFAGQDRLAQEQALAQRQAEEAAKIPPLEEDPATHLARRLEHLESLLQQGRHEQQQQLQEQQQQQAIAAANQAIAASVNQASETVPGFREGADFAFQMRVAQWRQADPRITEEQAQAQARQELEQFLYSSYAQQQDPAQALMSLAERYGMNWQQWAEAAQGPAEAEPPAEPQPARRTAPARLQQAQQWTTPPSRTAGSPSPEHQELMSMPLDDFVNMFSGFDDAGEAKWEEYINKLEGNTRLW